MLSAIVPIYNEEKILTKNFLYFQSLSKKAELIFVDGGSLDKSRELAGKCGEVLTAKKGRACQMNQGARYARKDILVFLHADTVIAGDTLISIVQAVRNKGYIGGCLTQRIEGESLVYRLIEQQGNIRARITKVFYGDQGIFVTRDMFLRMNGFPEVSLMEDVIFTRSLRRFGKTTVLRNKIFVSARRWTSRGIIKTAVLYCLLNILFWLNLPLHKIKTIYEDLR